jgi:tRNA nucleotidyltransferase (CCA-adding enzyme)
LTDRAARDARLRLPDDSPVHAIARACADAGGRALIVGGWVRDQLLERRASDDLDLEVQGLDPGEVESVLAHFGDVHRVGRAFPVLLMSLGDGSRLEVSLPRTGDPGADGAILGFDPGLSFEVASRGRDLRINAMGWDPLTGEVLDPHGGRQDVRDGALRATDPERFGHDPLRGLRTAQLAARLEMDVDQQLRELCGATDLDAVAPERVFAEFRRLLLKAREPSRALELLRETRLLRFFPELEALVDVPQDPQWHPEGDVWTHTLLVVDQAARLRSGADEARDLLLMLGALCHDLGKPRTTEERDGRIVSRRHSEEGIPYTESFLARMRAPKAVVRGTAALVRHHLAPAQFVRSLGGGEDATPRAYRRLLRKLREDGLDAELLVRVARADHLGRTTEEALAGVFPAGDVFLARALEVEGERLTYEPVVKGRHLLARGFEAGPQLGGLLERCREVQDETGWAEVEPILARALEGWEGES